MDTFKTLECFYEYIVVSTFICSCVGSSCGIKLKTGYSNVQQYGIFVHM